jgi:hypothetical protein
VIYHLATFLLPPLRLQRSFGYGIWMGASSPAPSTAVAPGPSSSPLNPLAPAFSPSSTPRSTASEDLPNWLWFSPSSSEGGLSARGRASFVDDFRSNGKGKAPAEGSSSRSGRDPTAPPDAPPPVGFMVDARQANGGAASWPQQAPLEDGGGGDGSTSLTERDGVALPALRRHPLLPVG